MPRCGHRSRTGDFPGPVKYGYLNVGVVEAGPGRSSSGALVFCLYPHQTAVRRAGRRRRPSCPTACPPARAVLAGTVETAVNALWDAAPLVGDRVAVVGAGMVGCCVARLLARIPGVARHPRRRRPDPGERSAAALGVDFALPRPRPPDGGRDLVVHTSATSAGPAAVPRPARDRGRRWSSSAGTATARCTLSLGGAFHSRRLGDPGQPGRCGRRRAGAADAATPTGSRWRWTCCATRRSTRCSPGRRRFDELPDGHGASRRRAACRRSATPSPTSQG